MKLTEGLRKGDLDGMVLPLITIDEYESKISNDKSIVVGFYVFEEDAAHDLSNFIERAPYMILDTDVSPAPTKDGYYVCFVEIFRSNDFGASLTKLLSDLTLLTNVEDWQFTTVKLPKDKIVKLNDETLLKYVDSEPRHGEGKSQKSVNEFFRDSSLSEATLSESQLVLTRQAVSQTFHLIDVVDTPPQGAMDLSESASGGCLRLQNLLGGPYNVHQIGVYTVVENYNTEKFMVLTQL